MQQSPPGSKLILGKEYQGENEMDIAEDIIKLLKDQMLRTYPPGKAIQKRQVHAKISGLVKAEFIIPELPADLRVGLFKEAKSYPAWIRFSNGETHVSPDSKKDFRGFAIKIRNVPGKKLDLTHPDITSHDFILLNNKTFISNNIKQFTQVLYVLTTPHKLSSWPRKFKIAVSSIPLIMKVAKAKVKIKHPAEIPYFSTTPYRFGDESKAVKYAVIPSPDNHLLYPDTKSKDFLSVNLGATLKEHQLVYDFCVQFQTDAEKMPIEDPTVEWTSEFVKLATIRIPIQVIDTEERKNLGENLSFNIWHCLREHQPLGVFNRLRRFIYEELYSFRHKHNNIEDKEPEAGPDFFTDTNSKVHG
jgi:hypothetical protein